MTAAFSRAGEGGNLRQNAVEGGLCGSASQQHALLVTQDCHRGGKTIQNKSKLKLLFSDS